MKVCRPGIRLCRAVGLMGAKEGQPGRKTRFWGYTKGEPAVRGRYTAGKPAGKEGKGGGEKGPEGPKTRTGILRAGGE